MTTRAFISCAVFEVANLKPGQHLQHWLLLQNAVEASPTSLPKSRHQVLVGVVGDSCYPYLTSHREQLRGWLVSRESLECHYCPQCRLQRFTRPLRKARAATEHVPSSSTTYFQSISPALTY